MRNFESFPTQEDWDDLHEETELDSLNSVGIVHPELKNVEPPIEPDWDALLDD